MQSFQLFVTQKANMAAWSGNKVKKDVQLSYSHETKGVLMRRERSPFHHVIFFSIYGKLIIVPVPEDHNPFLSVSCCWHKFATNLHRGSAHISDFSFLRCQKVRAPALQAFLLQNFGLTLEVYPFTKSEQICELLLLLFHFERIVHVYASLFVTHKHSQANKQATKHLLPLTWTSGKA